MPRRIIRRLSTTWGRDTLHILTVSIALGGVLAILGAALKLAFLAVFTLDAVAIPDHPAGTDPQVTIQRRIGVDFEGQYSAVIRDDSVAIVDTIPWSQTIRYRRQAYLRTPVLTRPLSYWLGGKDVLAAAEAEGFGAGTFTLHTCHRWMLGPIPLSKRCVASNPFTRF